MIVRVWHSWTTPENADPYEALLRAELPPAIGGIHGCRGAEVLRRDLGNEVEFVTILRFDNMEAVRAFAGENYRRAFVRPPARRLLSRFEEFPSHYEACFDISV
jgi:antibiotic biosynthesis monooxygenase (ABM) superfamily enzyme